MKVRATDAYKRMGVRDKDLGYEPEPGEEFEVDGERAKVLLGENPYNTAFIELIEEKKPRRRKRA